MLKEDFLERVKTKHPSNFDRYDYSSLPNEFHNKSKIPIICKIHGPFEQVAIYHSSEGNGCRICSGNVKSNTNEFVKKARKVHNDKYNYDKVNYTNNHTKVIINCPKHGDFQQSPIQHLSGKNCLLCSRDVNRYTADDFIRKAKSIHGDKYNYDKVNYKQSKIPVTITCFIHGDFNQKPDSHINTPYSGCPKCYADKLRLTRIDFLNKANKIHNSKYIYNDSVFENTRAKITVRCEKHGTFTQRTNHHLRGRGCPRCVSSMGEKFTTIVLNKYKIQFIPEYKTEDINKRYRYDFYLPEYNIYIEYHGRQHYEADEFFGGKKRLIKQQRADKIKIEIIKRSTGLLIVLKHTFNTLEKIENELLRIFLMIHPYFLSDKELVKQYIKDSNVYLIEDNLIYKR